MLPSTPAPTSAASLSKPRLISILPGFNPSTLMYAVKPFIGLEAANLIEFQTEIEAYCASKKLRSADLVVFCRNTEPKYRHLLDFILNSKIPFIYDIDDNFFEIPLYTQEGPYYQDAQRLELLKQYLSCASLVRVYSKPLLEKAKAFNPNVQLVDPPIDWRVILPPERRSVSHPVHIVYATSRCNDYLFPVFSEGLARILQDYGERVLMHFWGFIPPEFENHPRVRYKGFNHNYDSFMKQFSSQGFDIGLAPLLDDVFHRSKTNTKFREYGACGIAGVYSNVEVYANYVQDGVTGLLIENSPEAWYAAIARLIENAELCTRIGQNAQAQIRQMYSHERFQNVWWEQIQSTLNAPPPSIPYPPSPIPDVATSTAQPSTPTSAGGIWQYRLRRTIALLLDFNLKQLWINIQAHAHGLWWQFKINTFKHL